MITGFLEQGGNKARGFGEEGIGQKRCAERKEDRESDDEYFSRIERARLNHGACTNPDERASHPYEHGSGYRFGHGSHHSSDGAEKISWQCMRCLHISRRTWRLRGLAARILSSLRMVRSAGPPKAPVRQCSIKPNIVNVRRCSRSVLFSRRRFPNTLQRCRTRSPMRISSLRSW